MHATGGAALVFVSDDSDERLGVTSTVSLFVEYNVRKQRFNTFGMA